MRVVVDYDVDRLQVYNGDIKPSSTNCPNLFLKRKTFLCRKATNLREQMALASECFYLSICQPLRIGIMSRSEERMVLKVS